MGKRCILYRCIAGARPNGVMSSDLEFAKWSLLGILEGSAFHLSIKTYSYPTLGFGVQKDKPTPRSHTSLGTTLKSRHRRSCVPSPKRWSWEPSNWCRIRGGPLSDRIPFAGFMGKGVWRAYAAGSSQVG